MSLALTIVALVSLTFPAPGTSDALPTPSACAALRQDIEQDGAACLSALQVKVKSQHEIQHDAPVQSTGFVRLNLQRRQSMQATAELMYPNRLQYLVNMTVDGVDFVMSVDTGSSFLWVPGFGATCQDGGPCSEEGKTTLPNAVESEFGPFNGSYGGGHVWGASFSAPVTLAGLSCSVIAGAADHIGGWVQVAKEQEGLMGLAWPQDNTGDLQVSSSQLLETSVIRQLYQAGRIQNAMFSLKLPLGGEELHLGGVDHSSYTGQLTKMPQLEPGHWKTNIDAAYMGTAQISLAFGAVIYDSGFFSVTVPVEVLTDYNQSAWSNGIPMVLVQLTPGTLIPLVPCNFVGQLPGFTFTIGGVEHNLSAEQMANYTKDSIEEVIHHYDPDYPLSPTTCMIGMVSFKLPGADFILGEPFLRTVYTVFSMDPPYVAIGRPSY